MEQKWHAMSTKEAAYELDTDPTVGLSSEEAAQRLRQFGPNALAERPRPGFLARLW